MTNVCCHSCKTRFSVLVRIEKNAFSTPIAENKYQRLPGPIPLGIHGIQCPHSDGDHSALLPAMLK
jgi:hypothetical protein